MINYNRKEIRNAYGNWLNSINWDFWVTFTHRGNLTMPSLRRAMQKLWVLTTKMSKEDTVLFWCAENFELKEGCHAHALIKIPQKISVRELEVNWQRVSGNKMLSRKHWNKVDCQIYDAKRSAAHYVSKYIYLPSTDYDFHKL